MARKAVVSKDIILSMLREGETTQHIAEKFGVSRQAVDIHRRNFIENGLLPNQRAIRSRKTQKEAAPQKQDLISPRQSPSSNDIVALDTQIDLLINAFNALKRLPQLEKDIEITRQKYENALHEIERLEEKERRRLDQENRWLLAQHHNDSSPA